MQFNTETSDYLLELLRCALHDRTARPKPQDVSWSDVFALAKAHSLSYMAYSAIRKSGFSLGEALEREWSNHCAKTLVKFFNQDHECDALCEAFSEAGIANVPLKGSVICKLYPSQEMREMCDLDILVKPEDMERAHEVMLLRGYHYLPEHTTSHNRDYQKPPYLNVEVHFSLMPDENKMFRYYSDYWERTSCPDDNKTRKMSWDDCYIYNMAHAAKHFFLYGTGIRSVLDVYVMRNGLGDVLNRDYIAAEFNKLGISDFSAYFERLADCWFSDENAEISEDLQLYRSRVLESGTYGNDSMKAGALKYMQRGQSLFTAKIMMALSMIFPSYPNMRTGYPSLKKVPFLLPLYWVLRWIKTVLIMPKKIGVYLKKLKGLSLSDDDD